MKNLFFTLSVLIYSNCLFAQQKSIIKYRTLIFKAQNLYTQKKYQQSSKLYNLAFHVAYSKKNKDDYYNAACSFALSNQINGAFRCLTFAVKNGYYDEKQLNADADLMILHADKRWGEISQKVAENKAIAQRNYIKPLVLELDSVYVLDQKYRAHLEDSTQKYGSDSKQVNDLYAGMDYADSVNLIKVTAILDKYGWLGPDKVSERGSTSLFITIQHADKAIQEKYLPMMRLAVKRGDALGESLALLEDRVALENGHKQKYGTQLGFNDKTKSYYFRPIYDEKNVNLRRLEVGLQPIEDYALLYNIVYKKGTKKSGSKNRQLGV